MYWAVDQEFDRYIKDQFIKQTLNLIALIKDNVRI
jgi:hypothetical protein